MPRQIEGSQWNFSFGEVDIALKRADDHPARKGGLRQMANARILNSNGAQNRSGRRALYPTTNGVTRIEKFTVSAGHNYKIAFGNGRLQIIDNTETVVLNVTTQGNGAALPWTTATLKNVVYTILGMTVVVTFAGMRPQVLTWDGVVTWANADYTELVEAGGQKRTPFYRLSPQNVTLLPSAVAGTITVDFSSPIVVAGMVGTRVRYCNRQILLGSVVSTTRMNATVIEPLPPGMTLTVTGPVGTFNVGDEIVGEVSGALGILTSSPSQQHLNLTVSAPPALNIGDAITGGTSGATGIIVGMPFGSQIVVSLSTGTVFIAGETITGPSGSRVVSSVQGGSSLVVQLLATSAGIINKFSATEQIAGPSSTATTSAATATIPQAVAVWDDEVMNDFRGYPASCFTDQFRLGFCNFPPIPGGIAWSAINSQTDLYVGPNPDDAMFEIAPAKTQVLYVAPGPESSEFVFCTDRIFYIPISVTNPLKPGSVAFNILSGDGSAQVQPRLAQEAILYVNAGMNSMMAIIATGAFLRPFNTKNLSEFHAHLFNNIVAIAAPNADGTFNERYTYVLNGDGSIAVGKYSPESLQTNLPVVGWGPWSGGGTVNWISAWNADVFFTSSYFGTGICEMLDDTKYLDCALFVNALPTPFTAPGGKGPLWFIPSQTVTLMDQVTRAMGTYQIDVNGFIVPQNNGGEDLTLASLVAGQPWTLVIEPFAPASSPGADVKQRVTLRQISNIAIYFVNSTGFKFASLFSGKQTPTSPALGTVTNTRIVPAWNQGDDATKPPPLREWVESWTPAGSSYDPRVSIIKDTPGPLLISEIAMEVSL